MLSWTWFESVLDDSGSLSVFLHAKFKEVKEDQVEDVAAQRKRKKKTIKFFDRLWNPLGADLVGFWEPKWSQNWSRIGPKSDHEANANIFKFIGRGGVFEDRRCMESIKNCS